MENLKKNLSLIFFTLVVTVFALWYMQHIAALGGLEYAGSGTPLGRIGKLFGFFGFFAMGLVYARSILKILLREEVFWERLRPFEMGEGFDLKKISTRIFILLNKSHAFLGVLSVALIFLHCFLTGSYKDNLLLQVVLVLVGIEAITGLFMKLRYSPAQLRQESLLIHRQFVIGAIIILFTLFGHLLLKMRYFG